MSETAVSPHPGFARSLWRVLSCIRFDEVLALQGAPLIGAILSIQALSVGALLRGMAFTVGSLLLVAHVFVLNDWAGIHGDVQDVRRTAKTFSAKGASRTAMGYLAIALLATSLLVFAMLGRVPFVFASAIVGLSALYSAPGLHMKGQPIFGSGLHFLGGTIHFLLGCATFGSIGARETVIGCFFGLVFAAGHLMHETRGYEGDLFNGIQTNAVRFGKTTSFLAGLVLFTMAYGLLVILAFSGALPRLLALAGMIFALHVYVSLRALRSGLTFQGLLQLQKWYRWLFALIGALMVGPAIVGLLAR